MSNVSRTTRITSAALGAGLMLTSGTVAAQAGERPKKACRALPTQAQLKDRTPRRRRQLERRAQQQHVGHHRQLRRDRLLSGDTSCADHVIAWRVRSLLNLDDIPGGVADPDGPGGSPATDNIIYDLSSIEATPAAGQANTGGFTSVSGFGHPTCGGDADGPGDGDSESLGQDLPNTNPIGP